MKRLRATGQMMRAICRCGGRVEGEREMQEEALAYDHWRRSSKRLAPGEVCA
jgi:hypothetical protein